MKKALQQTSLLRWTLLACFFLLPNSAFAMSTDYSQYTPGQTINVTCDNSADPFDVFDNTNGAVGRSLGEFDCGNPVVNLNTLLAHLYVFIEVIPGNSCLYVGLDTCENNYFRAGVSVTVADTTISGSGHALVLSIDKTNYAVGADMTVVCAVPGDSFDLYDITNSSNVGASMGEYPCGPSDTITFDTSVNGHTYAVVEVLSGNSCFYVGYDTCQANYFRSQVNFTVGSGGGALPATPGLNKTSFAPGETIYATCQVSSDVLDVYRVADGGAGSSLGEYPCGSPAAITFDSSVGDYVLVEVVSGNQCLYVSYDACLSNYYRTKFNFSVIAPVVTVSGSALQPLVALTTPNTGDVFSTLVPVTYDATNSTQVIMYYSTTLADWSGEAIWPSDRVMIAQNLPTKGTYVWDTSKLPSGSNYRLVVDAIGLGGVGAEVVSGLITLDKEAPQFSVSANPAATHGEDVTISVDTSKGLQVPPVVFVTQTGGSPVAVAMSSSTAASSSPQANIHFEGTYKVVSGYDGAATVTVAGTSTAGNAGSTIVSGGTFAVGVNPPPKVHITSPLPNTVVGTSSVTLVGTTRFDTTVVVKVNGVDTYKATPAKDGTFTVANIALHAENGGKNTISAEAVDVTGIHSESVPVVVRYNLAPTVSIASPTVASTSLNGTVAFIANAADANNDPLTFTYQLISDKDYATATSSQVWTTLADGVASSRYNFDTTQLDDGAYYLRVVADDGVAKITSDVVHVSVRNTSPYFTFEDGRKSISKSAPVAIVGHALEPKGLLPQPNVTKVEFSMDGKKWKAVSVDAQGRFAVSFSNGTTTLEGSYAMQWRVTDSRKLTGRTTHVVVIDKTAPAVPTVTSPSAGAIVTSQADEDSLKDGVQITLAGFAEPFSVVTLNTAAAARTVKAGVNGSFAFSGVDITEGSNTFTFTSTDAVGNTSAPARTTYVYDNAPEVSILSPKPNRGFATHAPVAWKVSDADHDPIQGLTVSYRHAGGAFTSLPIANNATTYDWDVSALPQGSDYELRLTAGDGLATSTETTNFAVDRTAPTLTAITFVNTVLGKSGILKATGAAQDSLSGIEYVEYAIVPGTDEPSAADWYTALVTRGFLQNEASFTLSQQATLTDGTYKVYVRAVDAAGNVSAAKVQDITVDATPPRVGSFEALLQGVELAPDNAGALVVYASSTVLFGVSLEADTASASLTVEGKDVPLTRDIASGLWQAPVRITKDAPILLTAKDELGNSYTKKAIGTFTTAKPGEVTDSGSPVVGAKIRVLTKNERGDFVATGDDIAVDTNGAYQLSLAAGEYKLVAYAPGFQTITESLVLEHSALISTSFATQSVGTVRQFIQSVADHFNYGL